MSRWIDSYHKRSMEYCSNTEDKREKIQALSLAKECYSMKLDLLTNATVVDDAIRFVEQKSKDKGKISSSPNSNESNREESNEPDHDEEKIKKSAAITNHVF
jgi:hypothetical protein